MEKIGGSNGFPVRKNPRMRHYDYAHPGYYFVTICTKNKRCIFGNPGALNRCGRLAERGLQEIQKHFSNVTVDKYVVMPNHIHCILILKASATNLSVVVGQYKSAVTKHIRLLHPNLMVWQTSFHDHVIRDQRDYERIWAYIDTNPAKWLDDCFFME